jgi:hypothetical protein
VARETAAIHPDGVEAARIARQIEEIEPLAEGMDFVQGAASWARR